MISIDTLLLVLLTATRVRLDNLRDANEVTDRTTGTVAVQGFLRNLRVKVSGSDTVIVGSFARFVHGSNIEPLAPDHLLGAFTEIAEALGIAIDDILDALVRRLDVAATLVVSERPGDFLRALVEAPRMRLMRFSKTSGGFANTLRQLALYDKVAQLGGNVPDRLCGHHLLRAELRYLRQMTGAFDGLIFGRDLLDAEFLADLAGRWRDACHGIRMERVLSLDDARTVTELRDGLAARAILGLGEAAVLDAINAARAADVTTANQATRLRAEVRRLMACERYVVESDLEREFRAAVDRAHAETLAALNI